MFRVVNPTTVTALLALALIIGVQLGAHSGG